MTNLVQGNGVVLSFFKEDWVTYLCASDITVTLDAEVLPTRTISDGHWTKNTYQNISWTVTISGLLKINELTDTNFGGLDMIDNQLHFNHIRARCSFYDDDGNIKSLEGYCMVQGISLNVATGTLVKNDISLVGNGELKFFDGLIPCDSTISTITVTGQTAADGIVHISYTYTGAPYQVKYRIDGVGNYIYALVGTTLDIPGLALGSHSVEIIPVCLNGYESETSTSQAFIVTQALTCSAVFDDITITTTSATPHTSAGSPSTYKYSIDGGAWVYVAISFVVPLGGLSVGSHSIEMVPICSNSVEGTGFTKAFSVASQPAQSNVAWNFASWQSGNIFQIYVDGILNVSTSTAGSSGTITVPTGSTVKGVLQGLNTTGSHCQLQTQDTTLSSVLDNRTGTVPQTLQYSFITNGDDYSIGATITP